MRIAIARTALAAIRAHAAADPAREVCGLLFGSGDRIAEARATANIAENAARHFEIDPVALFAAIRAEWAGGAALIGCYHSHPGGVAEPSPRDAADAAPDGKLWLIVAGAEIRGWRAGRAGFVEVALAEE